MSRDHYLNNTLVLEPVERLFTVFRLVENANREVAQSLQLAVPIAKKRSRRHDEEGQVALGLLGDLHLLDKTLSSKPAQSSRHISNQPTTHLLDTLELGVVQVTLVSGFLQNSCDEGDNLELFG